MWEGAVAVGDYCRGDTIRNCFSRSNYNLKTAQPYRTLPPPRP